VHAVDEERDLVRIRGPVDAVAQIEDVRCGRGSLLQDGVDRRAQLGARREERGTKSAAGSRFPWTTASAPIRCTALESGRVQSTPTTSAPTSTTASSSVEPPLAK
jgi:hypothetical protein